MATKKEVDYQSAVTHRIQLELDLTLVMEVQDTLSQAEALAKMMRVIGDAFKVEQPENRWSWTPAHCEAVTLNKLSSKNLALKPVPACDEPEETQD